MQAFSVKPSRCVAEILVFRGVLKCHYLICIFNICSTQAMPENCPSFSFSLKTQSFVNNPELLHAPCLYFQAVIFTRQCPQNRSLFPRDISRAVGKNLCYHNVIYYILRRVGVNIYNNLLRFERKTLSKKLWRLIHAVNSHFSNDWRHKRWRHSLWFCLPHRVQPAPTSECGCCSVGRLCCIHVDISALSVSQKSQAVLRFCFVFCCPLTSSASTDSFLNSS